MNYNLNHCSPNLYNLFFRLSAYITNSRNIMRIQDRDSRRRYLRTGRLQVVSFLSDLPKTTHDLMGFAVDLPIFSVSIPSSQPL